METQARTGDWRITTLGTAIVQSRFRTLARPATPFELMDDAVSYYRENFKPLFRISLWVYLIPIVFSLLLLAPIVYFETSGSNPLALMLLDYLGLFLLLPYLFVAPIVEAAFITLAFRMIAIGEPITFRALWERLKPRFWHLIANQLLATLALGGLYTVLFLGYFLLLLAALFGVAALVGNSSTLGIILVSTLWLIITIPTLVLAALINVWFLILPQIVVLEENTDAITAFSRALALVRPNLKHAVLSCLAFWGAQTVFMLSVMFLAFLILGIVMAIIAIYADPEQIFTRWWLTINQLYESLSYVAYMFVMPAMYLTSILLYFDLRYRNEGLDIYEILQRGEG
ncbi:MAG: hypothetical protein KatS3mg016_0749 [Fimbriimonadales bacterium]|nr:MAG: hypothetical protein KatS3mg016_0749 [Fimbriimonadales bacterium]